MGPVVAGTGLRVLGWSTPWRLKTAVASVPSAAGVAFKRSPRQVVARSIIAIPAKIIRI
jgi:hypothetical protein